MLLKVQPAYTHKKYWKVALILLVAVYLCNFFTPLRLTNDTIRYIRLAEIQLGSWPLTDLGPDFLPHGYVWFLYTLAKLGILNPFVVAVLHWFYLLGSIVFLRKLFSSHAHYSWMVILLLLNWNTIKFTLTPLSEVQYLFFSSGALYFFHAGAQRGKPILLVAAILFAGIAVYTRTAGMSLCLALLLTPLIKERKRIRQWVGSNKLLTAGIGVAALVLIIFQAFQYGVQKYLDDYTTPFGHHPVRMALLNIWLHTQEIGELFINVPFSKVETMFPPSLVVTLYTLAGLVFVFLFMKALLSAKLNIPSVVRVYALIYFVMLYCWPMFEVRLWFPLFPLMLLVILLNAFQKMQYLWMRTVWIAGYCFAGLIALTYYTFLSYNKKAMANRHDAGIWRIEYRAHFYDAPYESVDYDPRAIYILNKYDKMHSGTALP